MKKSKKTILFFIFIILLVGGAFAFFYGTQQTAFYQGKEVTMLVPHLAALKCDVIDKISLTYGVPTSGLWISKNNIGFKAKVVSDIGFNIDYGFWESLGKDLRLVYKICDVNQNNCASEQYITYQIAGQKQKIFDSIDVSKNSIYIKLQKRTIGTLLQWKDVAGGTLSYSAEKYGLNLYSTTGGFRTVCYTSCDLNCLNQGVRDILIETPKDTLNFYESTNYLEYWTSPTQVGDQFGGTIWDSNKQQFCFGGFIYNAETLTTEAGKSYLYPGSYNGKVDCCNGARVDLTKGYKICENNKWRTILPDEKPECTSVIECPGNGIPSGQLVNSQPVKISYKCTSGKCIQQTPVTVQCIPPNIGCAQDQVCQDFKCAGGNTVIPPISITPNPPITEADCNPIFQVYKTDINKDYGFLYWRSLFGIPKITTTSYCATQSWIFMVIVGVVIIILVIIILQLNKPQRRRR